LEQYNLRQLGEYRELQTYLLNPDKEAWIRFDNNGNILTSVTGSNTTTYGWDFENRFTSVTLPGSGGTVTFKYDPFGRRIYKSSSSGASIFAYDGDNLVEEANSAGVVVARYSDGLSTQTFSISAQDPRLFPNTPSFPVIVTLPSGPNGQPQDYGKLGHAHRGGKSHSINGNTTGWVPCLKYLDADGYR
jgi:YD repeat-containing protein